MKEDNTIQYNTIQFNKIQNNTTQYNTIIISVFISRLSQRFKVQKIKHKNKITQKQNKLQKKQVEAPPKYKSIWI